MCPPTPRTTLFPYTTLFRSVLASMPSQQLRPRGLNDRVEGHPLAGRKLLQARAEIRVHRHRERAVADRKSTRLNSSHMSISYAVFCLKKKKQIEPAQTLEQY